MSFGFAVTNDLQRRVIDETHGLHVVVPATVTKNHLQFSEPYGVGYHWHERVGVTITFTRPYKGDAPPMVFMKGDGTHPSAYNSSWDSNFGTMWYNELRYQLYGGPGWWTGAFVGAVMYTGFSYSATPPAKQYTGWDLRSLFMVVGTAVDPGPDGMGAVVFDASGRVVFNSNDNFIEVQSYSNAWRYLSRENYGDQYIENWILDGLIVPTSASGHWVSLFPFSRYRRYNGEVAWAFPGNLTRGQNPQMLLVGGRSGSKFHMPVLVVKAKLPISYKYA